MGPPIVAGSPPEPAEFSYRVLCDPMIVVTPDREAVTNADLADPH
ncbi:hypothetical protein OO014_04185 [Intrasporangium calvum]|uniref:Uncharacterized protein n=1 Tax=Intrasporangium calvum TaxID=53358 RepID=A0ABT5GF44_9MICO|nr:hypothetical protein [Intrasporangium calvum]MDC5696445.1 hypothetical protein [Intrasporangium calvum]